MKKLKSNPKIGIRLNMVLEILIFLALKVTVFRWGEKKKKKREERREEEENPGLEFMFGTLVWNSCICKYGTYLYGFVG